MPRNVEIKARVHDLAALREVAAGIATEDPVVLQQHDVFYRVGAGRLKLRRFPDGRSELIRYQRSDASGPKTSDYDIFCTGDGQALHDLLAAALGVRGEVIKTRTLLVAGRTRIHLDRVAGLGDFMELEVVLEEGESSAAGEAEARDLMRRLGVDPDDLVTGAYLDLLEGSCGPPPPVT
jgi:adenylate cyclase class IV